MYGRIIERISCDDLGLVISITVAETGGVVVHPGNGTAVFLHLANVADVMDIGDPVVLLIQKSGKEGVGGGGAVKSAGPLMRSNPFTTNTVPLELNARPAERISEGKLSPPLLTAVTL